MARQAGLEIAAAGDHPSGQFVVAASKRVDEWLMSRAAAGSRTVYSAAGQGIRISSWPPTRAAARDPLAFLAIPGAPRVGLIDRLRDIPLHLP
jgi:hypothetical protein